MNETAEFAARALVIGSGATLVMDAWAALLRRLGVPSLNFAYLGRWLGHLTRGRFFHDGIATSPAVRGERLLGWCAHYSIGITFAALLLSVVGLEWARAPTLLPALVLGVVTVAAPLFMLQPAFGAGIASSNTPHPVLNTVKSLVTHVVFGVGLFFTAWIIASLERVAK
jgi:hypothetical protein